MYDPNSMTVSFPFDFLCHACVLIDNPWHLLLPGSYGANDTHWVDGHSVSGRETTLLQCSQQHRHPGRWPRVLGCDPGCWVVTPGAGLWPQVLSGDPGCWVVTPGAERWPRVLCGGWPRVLGLLAQSLVGQPHCCESNSWPSYITCVLIWS